MPELISDHAEALLDAWFARRGWSPFAFQREMWHAYGRGSSGLLHAPTGSGKTMGIWGGPILEWLAEHPSHDPAAGEHNPTATAEPIRVLWLTPLRALANDTAETLARHVKDLALPWAVELRTGDTSSATRQRQRRRLPTALITTPESLSLIISYAGASSLFRNLRCIVVDEWHELLGSKRGVQTELCLSRLRTLAPAVRTWGLSATLGNIDQALDVLVGPGEPGVLVQGHQEKQIEITTLRPESIERFPWAGHLGTRLLPQVVDAIDAGGSTLMFTNTRSQAEIWYQRIVDARPDWLETVALHHGSLERDIRTSVESRLRDGALRAVVCTSSLDLGVDFTPVDQVIQVGSPKGIARLLQRAGRSGHQPGAVSRVIGVPTNALELIEFAAAREAIDDALQHTTPAIEHRIPLDRPLDVLAQHLVTLGLGDGFVPDDVRTEIQRTYAYHQLTDEQWQWTLDFVTHGGPTLNAYPEYSRLVQNDGDNDNDETRLAVTSRQIARRHRMSIGTITAASSIVVRFRNGKRLGTIEENFIARLNPGDRFVFAGRVVELIRVREMTAHVRPAKGSATMPRWAGGRSPLSTQLANGIVRQLDAANAGRFESDELQLVRPLLELQSRWSRIPASDELLIERSSYRGVHHTFLFTFAGRLVNEGLMGLVAWRLSQERPLSLSMNGNDYGFELASRDPMHDSEDTWRRMLSPDNLLKHMLACLNATQMARRRFRDIAQIAGLVFTGFPGQAKTGRQLQSSSDLFFDVFNDFDADNLLLEQARREVLERELEFQRLHLTLNNLAPKRLALIDTDRISPLAFPLWAESIRSQQVTSESWTSRVTRMAQLLEDAALKT